MSLLAATQIPKPSDEQAFERASIPLWRGLLSDPNVQRNGRRGQRQNGVDLFGIRNGDATHQVGIQCKLKGNGQLLTEEEVRTEVGKALTFKPALREYFIITTAPDDVALQELARELSADQAAKGRTILIYVWGWNTLEERISEDAAARKHFDPDYGAFSERILDDTTQIIVVQKATRTEIEAGFTGLTASLARMEAGLQRLPGDATAIQDALEAQLDAEIDAYRTIASQGKPRTAKPLLEAFLQRVSGSASGRILFRAKANIGSCLLALGDNKAAATLLSDAYKHAPTEPKAIANKAFALLLQGSWEELLRFGASELGRDPTNDVLAGYVVQAARFDILIEEPLLLVPEALRGSAAVSIGHVDFLRHRGRAPEWWLAAREAHAAHPEDEHARTFAAEADLDEILRDDAFQRTRLFKPGERARVEAAAEVFQHVWDQARSGEGVLRPERIALCGDLIVARHALDDFRRAISTARQGLALAPSDVELATRVALAGIDGHDADLAQEALSWLPPGADATVLAFRLHAQRGDWAAVAALARDQATHIPEIERLLIGTTGRLAQIKLAGGSEMAEQVRSVAADVACDARSSTVVADFARREGFSEIAEEAFRSALACIGLDSHIAGRLMAAMHAVRHGKWVIAADLLDGHIAEDRDGEELRALATAFVNDSPIRQRALRFFERLPQAVRELPFYRQAEGLLHFNRGALKQAEETLRRAIVASPDLTNYLALFATLRRREQRSEIKVVLEALDPGVLEGTPGQKMYLAQEMQAAGLTAKAQAFAYEVLCSAQNDPDAALRYFGLMILDPNGRSIPRMRRVGVGAWVRLAGPDGENHSFLLEDGPDRPAEGTLSPKHPLALAAMGLKVGAEFTMPSAFGENIRWRVAEIKHKYVHALHDVMENYQTRFPDAKGLYRITMRDGDVQPALEQVKKVAESNRRLADLYLRQHLPMSLVASRLGGDAIGFAEYVRSLGHDVQVCVGNEPERLAAREIITLHRAGGAVLDTYTAWTAATMDALDVLVAVFGAVLIPQSVVDELRILRDKEEWSNGRSMTVSWHDGQFFRHEHTADEIDARRRFIDEQLSKIEKVCRVEPVVAPDAPSEVAAFLAETFDSHLLDTANLAAAGYVLVAEDMYFRQLAEAAVSVRGVWLQSIFAFAREHRLIDRRRYADLIIKLAARRHGHVSLEAVTLLDILSANRCTDLASLRAVSRFIGTEHAEMRSHLTVLSTFLAHLWTAEELPPAVVCAATGILLEQICRYRGANWAFALAFIKDEAPIGLRAYVDEWTVGHFLPTELLRAADGEVRALRARIMARAPRRRRVPALTTTTWPF